MNKHKITRNRIIGLTILPLALSLPITGYANQKAKVSQVLSGESTMTKNLKPLANKVQEEEQRQIVKEALDAAKATQKALLALQNNQPKQALAALQVASGNLHLLIARDPSLGMLPIDIQIQVLEGVNDLKIIKKLEDELDDLIDDKRYQAARPIIDSLVDELRVTTVYLPLATYPAAIDSVAPLIDAGRLDEAEQVLIDALSTLVATEEVTPLSIIRAEEKLDEAFQIEHKADLSKQDTKDKISELIKEATNNIEVAEALGYGTEDDYKILYDSIDALKKAIGTSGFSGEWSKVKKYLSTFKNKIVHPRS